MDDRSTSRRSESASSQSKQTYYAVLDQVREFPGILLGGSDNGRTQGTRMARLQAFLSALEFAELNQGDPPFADLFPWCSVHCAGIRDTNNAFLYWLEESMDGSDAAFERFFVLLDEFRSCQVAVVEWCGGPFAPTFMVGSDNPHPPEHPESIVIGRFAPSDVFFWEATTRGQAHRSRPFFRSRARARADAMEWWGIQREAWVKL